MGLGKKLGAKNAATEKILQESSDNVAQYGYNTNTINVQPLPTMTSYEVKEITDLRTDIQGQVSQIQNPSYLTKPTVPYDADSDRRFINELVVEKMWRIVMLNKLQGFYTQERLQKLVDL